MKYIDNAKGDQVLDDFYEGLLPQQTLPCDQNAEEVHREVSDPFSKEKAGNECKGPFIYSPPIHGSYDISNESVYQVQMEQSIPFVKSAFISTPLRLTGGGDTSFEYQDDMDLLEYQGQSISYPPNHDSHGILNESGDLALMEQSEITESQSPIDNFSG